jgi:hypothetical protein
MTKLSGFNKNIVHEMTALAALLVVWAMPVIWKMVCFEKSCRVVFYQVENTIVPMYNTNIKVKMCLKRNCNIFIV